MAAVRLHYTVPGASNIIAHELYRELRQRLDPYRDTPVFACIGTDTETGDCLGPLVGDLLGQTAFLGHYTGSLASPIPITDVPKRVARLHLQVSERYGRISRVIVIDAGRGLKPGTIVVERGAIRPGAGAASPGTVVGDWHIGGVVVDHDGHLDRVPLGLVMGMARTIATALVTCQEMWEAYAGRPVAAAGR